MYGAIWRKFYFLWNKGSEGLSCTEVSLLASAIVRIRVLLCKFVGVVCRETILPLLLSFQRY